MKLPLTTSNKEIVVLLLTIVSWVWLPLFFTKGLFVDGITYGTLSNNLSLGIGSSFSPYYTATLHPHFFEHPPLVFIIQRFFFDVFGPSLYTENIFSATQLILSFLLFIKLEKELFKKALPLSSLLFFTTPLLIWGFTNNLLENTLIVFCLTAILLSVRGMKTKSSILQWLSGVFIFLAFLVKGPVGLFPLAVPLLWVVSNPNQSLGKGLLQQLSLILSVIVTAALSFSIWPELLENIEAYFTAQLLPALSGNREVTTSFRGNIILSLIIQLIVPIIMIMAAWIFSKKAKPRFNTKLTFILLLGISASVPLIITHKQRDFYLMPSLVLFLLFASHYLNPIVHQVKWNPLKNPYIYKSLWAIAFAGVIYSLTLLGGIRRDGTLQEDILVISEKVGVQTILQTHKSTWNNWRFQAYFMRLSQISLDDTQKHKYQLITKGQGEKPNAEYKKVALELTHFDLYEAPNRP